MMKIIIVSALSFVLGFFIRSILERTRKKKRFKKVKRPSEMTPRERRQHRKDIEIK